MKKDADIQELIEAVKMKLNVEEQKSLSLILLRDVPIRGIELLKKCLR